MGHILGDFLAARRQEKNDARAQELVQGLLGTAGTPGRETGPGGMGAGLAAQPGTGLLSDVNDPNRQATFAAGLLGNQQLRSTGASLLGGVFNDQGAMDRTRASNAAAFRRQALTSQTSLTNAQLQREQQQRQFEQTFQQNAQRDQLTRDAAADAAGGVQFGKPPTGFARVPLPDGGFASVMIPGEPPFQKAQGAAIETRNSAGLIDGILDQLISADGFEAWGRAAGRITSQTAMIRDSIRIARGMGAPQAAELELLAEQIPDISEKGARFGFAQKSRFIGIYTELRRELMRSFDMQRQLAGMTDIPELRGDLAALPTDADAALPPCATIGRRNFQAAPPSPRERRVRRLAREPASRGR